MTEFFFLSNDLLFQLLIFPHLGNQSIHVERYIVEATSNSSRMKSCRVSLLPAFYTLGDADHREAGYCLYHLTLPAVGTLKRYSKALEYEYRVKTAALDTLKRYSILSLALYLE
jgi:hypothetical protein